MDDTVAVERRRGRIKGVPNRNPPGPPAVRQGDLGRAIRAAKKAGFGPFRVDIDKEGQISLVPVTPGDPADGGTAWDKWAEDEK